MNNGFFARKKPAPMMPQSGMRHKRRPIAASYGNGPYALVSKQSLSTVQLPYTDVVKSRPIKRFSMKMGTSTDMMRIKP